MTIYLKLIQPGFHPETTQEALLRNARNTTLFAESVRKNAIYLSLLVATQKLLFLDGSQPKLQASWLSALL